MDALRIQAEYVVASPKRLLHPGQVVIGRGEILEVTDKHHDAPDLDLPNCVLIPGLINAHTHLEFSDLQQPFPAGDHFPEWISNVVAHRRRMESQFDAEQLASRHRIAIRTGLQEAFSTGTYVLADIVSAPWQVSHLPLAADWPAAILKKTREIIAAAEDLPPAKLPRGTAKAHWEPVSYPQVLALPEIIGLTEDRLEATLQWSLELLQRRGSASDTLLDIGISPHAPYSILPEAVAQGLEQLPRDVLTASHIAESLDELKWLQEGAGAFRESFDRLGLPSPNPRPTIQHAIGLLATRQRSLLIHGNWLTEDDARQVARSSAISIVYCPRTHAYFDHPTYPLATFRKHGIRVVLGTDSRASNPDLNLWSEVVEARHRHADLAPQDALAAVTLEAARALGIDAEFGSLEPGKRACLAVRRCDSGWTPGNLLEEMTSTPGNWRPLALFAEH